MHWTTLADRASACTPAVGDPSEREPVTAHVAVASPPTGLFTFDEFARIYTGWATSQATERWQRGRCGGAG